MPRLPPAIIRNAARISRHLPLLLQECRDLHSARNELRWMKETILERQLGVNEQDWQVEHPRLWNKTSLGVLLESYVRRRARGEPLQYILGTQPFGDLEIKCRPHVLIPRPETESYTTELGHFLSREAHHLTKSGREGQQDLTIADFCTGSGCIALLLYALLKPCNSKVTTELSIRGFDISQHALNLAARNLQHNLHLETLHQDAAGEVSFEKLDLLSLGQQDKITIVSRLFNTPTSTSSNHFFDVIVSNPPYISPQHFKPGGPTSKSVRRFEPRLALVPPSTLPFRDVDQADQFYVVLLHVALATQTKLLIMEVGDTPQALRVLELCKGVGANVSNVRDESVTPFIELWRDDGKVVVANEEPIAGSVQSGQEEERDAVEYRAVVVWFHPDWIATRQATT